MIVVADTTPLLYLSRIRQIELLRALYQQIAAITLAELLAASVLLIDERKGRAVARARGGCPCEERSGCSWRHAG